MSNRTQVLLMLACLALWGLAGHFQYEDEMAAARASGYQTGGGLRLACRLGGQSVQRQSLAQTRLTRISTGGDNSAPLQELRCVVLEFDEED